MGRGQLVFKGEEPKKKRKKTKHKTESSREDDDTSNRGGEHDAEMESSAASEARPPSPAIVPTQTPAAQTPVPAIQTGIGKITTSGTVVTGHGTKFGQQLNVGDAMLATTLTSRQPEMRVVTMRLSDTSINLSSAFSSDLKQPTAFQWIAKPRSTTAATKSSNTGGKLKPEEQAAFGTFSSHKELIYHEKTEHGSYRIKTEKLERDVTRSDLLSMRAKRKSDKYC